MIHSCISQCLQVRWNSTPSPWGLASQYSQLLSYHCDDNDEGNLWDDDGDDDNIDDSYDDDDDNDDDDGKIINDVGAAS